MLLSNNNCHNGRRNDNFEQVVDNPVSLYNSIRGRYFVGQTDTLTVGNGLVAWASLVNPRNSRVNLFANVFTVSNFSNESLLAQIWLNTDLPDQRIISQKVSPTNTAIRPLPRNKVNIEFVPSTLIVPTSGINVYERIVPPKATLVSEEDGKFIEPPRGNYTLVIRSLGTGRSEVVVALGWWEKPRC